VERNWKRTNRSAGSDAYLFPRIRLQRDKNQVPYKMTIYILAFSLALTTHARVTTPAPEIDGRDVYGTGV